MTKTSGVIYIDPPSKPFLIIQVIFFIAVSCKVYAISKVTQAYICKSLHLGHNFLLS